jgi:hypothetical protein
VSAEQVARAHQNDRKRLSGLLGRLIRRLWTGVGPDDLDESWRGIGPQLLLGVAGAQLAAARQAEDYVNAAMLDQDLDPGAAGELDPARLAGIASDGRGLDSLLRNPIAVVKSGIGGGASVEQSMAAGFTNLDLIVRTQLADAGRAADQVAMAVRPAAEGFVRMLSGKSCSRCVVLAGRWYRWDAGFNRHPRCDCVGLPAAENVAGDLTTDPRVYFDSLDRAEQDKAFTKAGAEAIREGADIAQVVNARRGMETAAIGGQRVLVTTEAAGRRPRLMPEAIFDAANGDREQAIRLLKLHGYIR